MDQESQQGVNDFRWDFIQKCSRLTASNGCLEMAKDVVNVLVEFSVKPYDIGEVFVIDAISTNRIELTLGLVKHWSVIRNDLVRIVLGAEERESK